MSVESTPFPIGMIASTIPANEGVIAMLDDDGQTLLVSEIHHRVMNSYQVISALAQRCGRIRKIDELQPVLDDLANRLTAFAAVHRQLAMPPSGSFADYCSALGENLIAAFGHSDTLHVDIDTIDLPQTHLAQIALIVAELLTNCLKHSLVSTASGSIRLDLHVSDGLLVIEAQDSAAGPITSLNCNPSRVVSALSANLGGDADVVDREGYCARVTLPVSTRDAPIASRLRNIAGIAAPPELHLNVLQAGTGRETVDAHS